MSSAGWYTVLLLVVAAERGVELVVSQRNAGRALARGGVEYGREHYPAMVLLHAGLLAACLLEVRLANRPFDPVVGWPMVAVVVAAQAVRWWCVRSLGGAWSTRVIVVPRAHRVCVGPYRFLRHPNYLAVTAEVAALPLVHSAWATAVLFSLANAWMLLTRIPVEETALRRLAPPVDAR